MIRAAPRPFPDNRDALRLWLHLLKSTRFIEGELRARLRKEFHTTMPRFDVLSALDRTPEGLTMSELSGQLMVSNGNVTGIVERLVREGLVIRLSVTGDRRATRVRLTPEGQMRFEHLAAAHAEWIAGLMAGLNPEEIETMSAMAARLRELQA